MLCKRYRPAQVAAEEYAAANFAPQYVPFVSGGLRFTPTADIQFKQGDALIAYFEIYEPLIAGQAAGPVQAQARVLGANGDTALKIPFDQFKKGDYRLEVHAVDASGKSTSWQTANFTVQ